MFLLPMSFRNNDCRMRSLRYCLLMKKPNLTKLIVRRETLRALAGTELTRVVGGDDAVAKTDSCAAVCPGATLVPPPQN